MLRKVVAIATMTLIAVTCRDSSAPAAPDRIVFSASAVTLNAIGATQTITATVQDANGSAVRNAPITWLSSAPAVVVMPSAPASAAAQLVARSPGSAIITARSGDVSATLEVEVEQVIAELQKTGDAQVGQVGARLPQDVRVKVLDARGHAIPNISVEFEVTKGGGSLTAASVTSGIAGAAFVGWTLGTSIAESHEVTASAGDVSVSFSAIAVPGAPAAMEKLGGDAQVAPTGHPVPVAPALRVLDAYGNRVGNALVTFVPSAGGAVTHATRRTDADGVATAGSWILGYPAGEMTLTATVASSVVLEPMVFAATATPDGFVPTTATVLAGEWQAAVAGTDVPVSPAVVVRDLAGVPQGGRRVTFEVTSGGGATSESIVTTDESGVARVSWTMGEAADFNSLEATVEGGLVSGNGIRFEAAGCTAGPSSGFAISVCFVTPITDSQRSTFLQAAAKWSSIITGDLPSLEVFLPQPACGGFAPALDMVIDDLVIFARIEPIDGGGGVLGSAGWCYRRSEGLPLLGGMRFDVADVMNLQASGRFEDVILHEMGHVLGIGTLWNSMGFLQAPSRVGEIPLDTHFSGPWAISGFDQIGGLSYTMGAKVPVENSRGPGSINSHWRETVLGAELMTPAINIGVRNPLTVLTALSLRDLGYEVNPSGADPLSIFGVHSEEAIAAPKLWLGDDVDEGPRFAIDRLGRVNRIR